jgi:hypothetical protein
MTPKEKRIEQMKNRIDESKKELEGSSQVGPVVVIFFGIVLFLSSARGYVLFSGIGFITVLLGIVWAYSKSNRVTKLKKEIYQYEGELYNLEKEP